jgi:hypothetical protein
MTVTEARAAVVAEAKTWLATKYIARARVKGAGVDCAQSLIAWYVDTGMLEDIDPGKYAVQWGQNQSEEKYLNEILKHATEITEAEVLPADMVLYRLGRTYCHGALIIDWPHVVIHASQPHGVQYAHGADESFLHRRDRKFFRLNRWMDTLTV